MTAVPNACYQFVSWSDGSTLNPRTDTNVQANVSVTASFAISTYMLTYAAGANGTISCTSPQTVNCGASGTAVTALPNDCYHFVSWSDGVLTETRIDTNIQASLSVTAAFAIQSFHILASAGPNGTIAPSGSIPIDCGANRTFLMTPSPGYVIQSVVVNDVNKGKKPSYTFFNTFGDQTIVANFVSGLSVIEARPAQCGNIAPILLTITGSSFLNSATAALEQASLVIPADSVSVVSGSLMVARFDITNAPLGSWSLRVSNPNNTTDVLGTAFTVTNAIDAVTPAKHENIGSVTLTISGCGFQPGATLKLRRSGSSDVTGSETLVPSTGMASATFLVNQQTIGLWDVVHSAQRRGSLDGSIRSAVLNDVAATFGALPDLRCLAFNGKLAARTGLAWESGVPAVVLPSSSAANTMRFDAKREHWLALRAYLD